MDVLKKIDSHVLVRRKLYRITWEIQQYEIEGFGFDFKIAECEEDVRNSYQAWAKRIDENTINQTLCYDIEELGDVSEEDIEILNRLKIIDKIVQEKPITFIDEGIDKSD